MVRKMEKAQVSTPSDREVHVVRSFDAPRALVYRAYTEPALMQRWLLGSPGWTFPVCEMDVRVGGKYLWRWRNSADGSEFGFSGEFRAVEPAARLVHTQIFHPGSPSEAPPGGESLITLTFQEQGGITMVTTQIKFASKEERDGAVASGMTDGMERSYQLLDKALAE